MTKRRKVWSPGLVTNRITKKVLWIFLADSTEVSKNVRLPNLSVLRKCSKPGKSDDIGMNAR